MTILSIKFEKLLAKLINLLFHINQLYVILVVRAAVRTIHQGQCIEVENFLDFPANFELQPEILPEVRELTNQVLKGHLQGLHWLGTTEFIKFDVWKENIVLISATILNYVKSL